MKIGLTSYAYAWAIGVPGFPAPESPMSASALLHRAASLGLEVVQLCDNLPLLALDSAARRALAAEAAALRLELELGGRGLTPQNLDDHLVLARDLGARLLRFVIDGPGGYHPSLDEAAAIIRPRLDALEEAGLTLAIENHDRFRAVELAACVRSLAHPRVGICLDTANSLGAGEDFSTVFAALGPLTVNLHVKDVLARRLPHQLGFSVNGCAAGRGVVAPALPAALASLAAGARCRSVLLESWPEPGPNLAETCAREDSWAAEGAAWIKPLLHQ